MNLLVSACLLGICTRYDGGHSKVQAVLDLASRHTLVPVCPEQLGGLSTPRPPCEIVNGRVLTKNGLDTTDAFVLGAEAAMNIYHLTTCRAAVLKSRSPSCGKDQVYDGSFTGRLTSGHGIFARLLLEAGISVYDETETQDIL